MEIVLQRGAARRRTSRARRRFTPGAPLLVDKYLRGLEVEVDAAFDGEDILDPGHLRARRTRRHALRRFDHASSRRRRSTRRWKRRIADVTARDRARARDSRPDQHSVRHPRRARSTSRSQPARQPHRADHLEGDRHQSRRRRDAHRARREAARHAVGDGLASAVPLHGRQSAGVLVRQDARRRDDPRTGDEVDRRGAWASTRPMPARCSRASSAPASACRGNGGRILVSIADEEKAEAVAVLRRFVALGHHAGRDARDARAARSGTGIPAEPINKIADGSPHVLDVIAARARRSRRSTMRTARANSPTTTDSPRGGRSQYRVFDESRYRAGAGGGARKPGWAAAQPARVSQRTGGDRTIEAPEPAQVFVLGGNASTLAFINAMLPTNGTITARLVPLAWTPLGPSSETGRRSYTCPSKDCWTGSTARSRPKTSTRSSRRCATSNSWRESAGTRPSPRLSGWATC